MTSFDLPGAAHLISSGTFLRLFSQLSCLGVHLALRAHGLEPSIANT